MAYQIDRYNNTILTVVEDGTVDNTTDLRFVGKNYAGYGEIQNENFLYLLENFSGANAPPRALSGQVWFDSANSKLKFYDGSLWRTTGGSEVGSNEPGGLSTGDFWWDTENDQLYVWNGTAFVLIGPQNAGEGITQMVSRDVVDSVGNNRSIVTATVNDDVIFVISNTEFTLNNSTPIEGFDRIKKGTTLKWTRLSDNGITNSTNTADRDYRYWGTASNAEKLGGRLAEDYLLASNATFQTSVQFGDVGYTIGDDLDLRIYVENGNQGVIENTSGQSSLIKIKNRDSNGIATHSVTFTSEGIAPATTGTFKIGTATNKWLEVHANSFKGIADTALALTVAGSSYPASTSATANTIAARDGNANITANLFQGIATQARYADLAEKYTTSTELAPGTAVAVCVHDDHEVAPASASDMCIGVVSTDPALMMNSEADGQYIGLKGRLPVRVSGPVNKGQAVYAWNDGVCRTIATSGLVGVALETNHDEGEKLVECVLKV